jgi:soluble lytic murein transglycosylase-like protein
MIGGIMTYWQIISAAAKAAKVSAVLLYAICAHESRGFELDYSMYDNGTPSYGVCQLKSGTALMMNWHGKDPMELRNPRINAKYAALYLKYQQDKYGPNDWVKLASAYNAGSYQEGKIKGCPRNLRYIKLVREKLPRNLRYKLSCGK